MIKMFFFFGQCDQVKGNANIDFQRERQKKKMKKKKKFYG